MTRVIAFTIGFSLSLVRAIAAATLVEAVKHPVLTGAIALLAVLLYVR